MTETKITKEEVKHIAGLAKLPVSDTEIAIISAELSYTVSHINNLSELDNRTENLSETNQVSGLLNVFREDEIDTRRTLTQEDALKNAKRKYNGYFVVKRVIG